MRKPTVVIVVALLALVALSVGITPRVFAQAEPGSMALDQVYSTLLSQANDVISKANSKDAAGAKAALATFQATFKSHEAEIRAYATATADKLAKEIGEVSEGLEAGNFDKAADDAGDLVESIHGAQAAMTTVSGGGTTTGNGSMPTAGQPDLAPVLALLAAAVALVGIGKLLRQKTR